MKKYYVNHYMDFFNTYRLVYTDETMAGYQLGAEWERITRAEADKLAREESSRRRVGSSFAGVADDAIYPATYGKIPGDWPDADKIWNDERYELRRHVYEWVANEPRGTWAKASEGREERAMQMQEQMAAEDAEIKKWVEQRDAEEWGCCNET